jgi:hypothetical protein
VVVLACIAAGIIETILFVLAVHNSRPDWSLAVAVSRAVVANSSIGAVSGAVGLFQKPTSRARLILVLGVVLGLLGLWFSVAIAAVAQICWICI